MAAKGGGGTIYLIGLIFAIIVAFVLLGVAYYMNTQWAKAIEDLAKEQAAHKRDTEQVQARNAEIQQLRSIINGNPNESVSYDSIYTTYLVESARKLSECIQEEWIANEEWKTLKDKEPAIYATWQKLAEFKEKQPEFKDLISYQKECISHLQAVLHVVPRLRIELQAAKEANDNLGKQIKENQGKFDKQLQDLSEEKAKIVDAGLEKQRVADQLQRELREKVERLEKNESRAYREHVIEVSKRENEIKKLQLRIDELTKKQRKSFFETAKPDGEVQFADAQLGYAWIDLGKKDGLRRGTRFQIYTNGKGGRQRIKGFCEVKKIDQDMAQVAILPDQEYIDPETKEKFILPDPQDPIVKGDLIRTPVFEKDAQPKFYFLGQRLTNRYYNLAELERKIEEFGGKVLKELTVEVEYVVVLAKGEEDTKNYEKAIQFGVTFMKEEELLDFVGK